MSNVWKLQDAKARFSQLVRQARGGEPQRVTVHGKDAVVVIDPERYEIKPKAAPPPVTMAEFIEASKKYRGVAEGIDFDCRVEMDITPRRVFPDEDEL